MGIPSTDPLALEHHVGLRFTSPSEATLPKLVFGRTSSLSQTIRENEKFRMEVLSRVTSARPAIEAFFLIPGNATQTYRLTTVRTRSTVFYENSGPIPDALFLTFGKAAIEIAVTADIVKIASNPSRFRIEQASVDGIHIDLYDWDHDIDSNQARVQAGHRTLGSAGSVFLSEVDLTGGVPLLHGTVF